ncbi:DoxX family protein [Actinosynnema pretiosum subsp. pretiosum]|uniref:DoxX family protein n=2 Tax=Actinosynnema TaxID=40566 RepID=C6WCG3_ACTMD|nr:DoxX family protein [Actinosynnema mirum]ACU33984.1 DoxX family protein [Actinosynnema mirum DSM 43827]AXX27375.1 membrane protein [Actinosynnema pretiosum subsp. pretiosum]QUF01896.1 DoxX family protein [Actinosynnema pretiosum subsp. pretiosum]
MSLLDRGREQILSIFRIVIAFFMICHGAQKVFGVLGGKGGFSPLNWPSGPAGLIEVVGGALVLIGLWTRVASIIVSGAMAYAYFVVHQPMGLLPIENKGELAAVYSWAFLLLAFTGPGVWAVDTILASRKKNAENRELANAAA